MSRRRNLPQHGSGAAFGAPFHIEGFHTELERIVEQDLLKLFGILMQLNVGKKSIGQRSNSG